MLSVGTIRFEDRLCTRKKGGIWGQVSALGALHMAAALAGYRKALINTGWAFLTQTGVDRALLSF